MYVKVTRVHCNCSMQLTKMSVIYNRNLSVLSDLHVESHMLLSSRRTKREADCHKLCEKGSSHGTIYKSLAFLQCFCGTITIKPAG